MIGGMKGRKWDSARTGNRKSIRLPDYDYSKSGYYFVTLALQNRSKLFWDGNILNDAGAMVESVILEIPKYYSGIGLDEFVVMPDHAHVIFKIDVGADSHIRPKNKLKLSEIIQRFKIMTTNKYISGVRNENWKPFDGRLWQRDYYERIVRDPMELDRIKIYVKNNPNRLLMNVGADSYIRPE